LNIKDIAQLAGVSKATVSRVLNNIKVRPEYKEKVDRVLKETGYKPNRIARELVSKKTKLIGMIMPSIKPNVYSHVVEGVNRLLQKKGYSLILTTTLEFGQQSSKHEVEALEFMKDRQVEGVIYVPQIICPEIIEYLKDYDTPIVSLTEKLKGTSIPALTFDDYNAAKSIVQHLIDLGHKDIAFIGITDEYYATGFLRKKGYMDALKENNMPIDDDRIINGGFTLVEGYSSARELMNKGNLKPTAIFAALDRIAYGTMSYLNKAGYRVPEDISVVGIDDDDLSSYYTPPLTTIYYDFVKTGEIIANMLLQIINDRQVLVEDRKMGFSIRKRGSAI
jgi:DNA-binding LacI/PurR family transcriptional regulator